MTNEATPTASQLENIAPKTCAKWHGRIPYATRYGGREEFKAFLLDAEKLDGLHPTEVRDPLNVLAARLWGRPVLPTDDSWTNWLAKVYDPFRAARIHDNAPEARKPRSYDDRPKERPKWALAGLIQRGQIFMVSGQRKAGKSLVAFDMGLCVATGREWHDRPVQQGRVLYLLGEGSEFEMWDRVSAWVQTNARNDKDAAALWAAIKENWRIFDPVLIDHADAVADLLADIGGDPWALIIVDPIVCHMTGDINSQSHAAAFIRGVKAIIAATGAAVLLIHHEGKDARQGPAGSFQWEAVVDGAARLSEAHKFEVTLMRFADAAKFPALTFELAEQFIREGDPDDFGDVYSYALRTADGGDFTKADLAAWIARHKVRSVADLLKTDLPISRSTALRYLKALRADGKAGGLQ